LKKNTWITESIKFINVCTKPKKKEKANCQILAERERERERERGREREKRAKSTVSQSTNEASSSATVIFEDLLYGSRTGSHFHVSNQRSKNGADWM
jgi:hypothetical protein